MQIILNEKVIKESEYTLGEILLLLSIGEGIKIEKTIEELIEKKIIIRDKTFNKLYVTNLAKEQLENIIVESGKIDIQEERLQELAEQLKEIFPKGVRPGTNLYWAEGKQLIIRRLKLFFRKFEISYSNEQILNAAKKYVQSFNGDYTYMQVLKYFICKDKVGVGGSVENESQLLNFIENADEPTIDNEWTSNVI